MAKKPTAAQLARKQRKQERRQHAIANRPSHEQMRAGFTRTLNADKWHSTAAHEVGHAMIAAVLGLPIKEVQCRRFRNSRGVAEGNTEYGIERRAYAARAAELPATAYLWLVAAGAAGTRVAGFSAREADKGTEDDKQHAKVTRLLATGKAKVTRIDLKGFEVEGMQQSLPSWLIDRFSLGRDEDEQLDERLWQRACGIAEQVLRKEKVALRTLVEELRHSPRGWMRGGRVGEVLFSHGVDVSGAREWLLAEAKKLDKDIGGIAGVAFQGLTAKQWEQRSRQSREHRNAADRARRARIRSGK